MKAIRSTLVALVSDERGGALMEYALVTGMIVIGCIAAIASLGGCVFNGWKHVEGKL